VRGVASSSRTTRPRRGVKRLQPVPNPAASNCVDEGGCDKLPLRHSCFELSGARACGCDRLQRLAHQAGRPKALVRVLNRAGSWQKSLRSAEHVV